MMTAVPIRLILSTELFEMFHRPYKEEEFQIKTNILSKTN